MHQLRERLHRATEQFDESKLPPRFSDTRDRMRQFLDQLEADGVREETLITVLINEVLPRLLARHGLLGTGAILRRLAEGLDPNPPPGMPQQ